MEPFTACRVASASENQEIRKSIAMEQSQREYLAINRSTMTAHPSSATTVFLDQPPSCMQFCPAAPNAFVVGTYLLSEKKDDEGSIEQSKTGSLQLWSLDPEKNAL